MISPLSPHSRAEREGIIIRYTGRGQDIVAEASPLKGFSMETLEQVAGYLAEERVRLSQLLESVEEGEQVSRFLQQHHWPPSLQFATCALALHLLESENGSPFLLPGSPAATSKPLLVNAMISRTGQEQIRAEIEQFYRQGFRTIKIKSGYSPLRPPGAMPSDLTPEELSGLIRSIAPFYPDLAFRIDANRSWPAGETAQILQNFAGLPVEYIEEPTHFDSLSEFKKLREESPVPLALDESIGNQERLRQIISDQIADLIIIKPMLLGDIFRLAETFSKPEASTIGRVCTTLMESGVGRHSVAKAASVLGSHGLAHGLDTGRFLKEDLYQDPESPEGGWGSPAPEGGWGSPVPSGWCIPWSQCRKAKLAKIELE